MGMTSQHSNELLMVTGLANTICELLEGVCLSTGLGGLQLHIDVNGNPSSRDLSSKSL